jgi:H+/Cl- antiporter ClcA
LSRDQLPDPPETPQPPDPGRLRPTSPASITAWAVVGLVCGWLLHPVAEEVRGTAPVVTWVQPLTLLLVAAILGWTAWVTYRAVQVRRERLLPHQAVNRLVLARACVLVGALVAGGYLGYAVSWLGIDSDLAQQRLVRSLLATAAGVLICVGAVALERACRVRSDDEAQ